MSEGPDREPSPARERDWSPGGGPNWLLDRQRSLLDHDEDDASAHGSRRIGWAGRLIALVLVAAVAVLMVLLVLLLKTLF